MTEVEHRVRSTHVEVPAPRTSPPGSALPLLAVAD
jgi:hypothetical protein